MKVFYSFFFSFNDSFIPFYIVSQHSAQRLDRPARTNGHRDPHNMHWIIISTSPLIKCDTRGTFSIYLIHPVLQIHFQPMFPSCPPIPPASSAYNNARTDPGPSSSIISRYTGVRWPIVYPSVMIDE